ncbi:unnamed protein product [Adineta steineri]|uniref:Bridge-like lipid transfer protein family member 1 C-terminal domain-containing protein n=1 Tax=Adineta steineri TaxID=433720 RepID=A0A819AD63_9BILA|nr:unnamed protein product [Adineta steineri]CAF3783150.1 unnamed protein product [Adineta steineri]
MFITIFFHRFLIEDQSSATSFPIDVVFSLFIQSSVLLFKCLPTHRMECELRLPTADVVFSSKHTLLDNIPLSPSTTNVNESEQILENSLGGLRFSLYMKDFKLNVYHSFSATSVQSVSFNISRTRYTLIEHDGEFLNNIQLSIIGQLSKAQFEYDIKRDETIPTTISLSASSSTASNRSTRSVAPTIIEITTNKQLRKEARVLLAI